MAVTNLNHLTGHDRDRTGVRITLGPFGLEHLVEGTGELLIAVADEEAHLRRGIVKMYAPSRPYTLRS